MSQSNYEIGATAAAAPPPFRPGNPALCGSCPLVTPYYCRLGDLLCYNCMLYLSYHFVCMHVYFVFSMFSGLFSFVDFPSVLWYCWLGLLTCKNRLPYNLYCVGGDVKHCTLQSNPIMRSKEQGCWAKLSAHFYENGSIVALPKPPRPELSAIFIISYLWLSLDFHGIMYGNLTMLKWWLRKYFYNTTCFTINSVSLLIVCFTSIRYFYAFDYNGVYLSLGLVGFGLDLSSPG